MLAATVTANSAVETEPARELEPRYAQEVPVVSTASAFRYEDDVPILVPGVNLDHARLIATQRLKRGWKGFITPNPNCTTTGLVMGEFVEHRIAQLIGANSTGSRPA